MNTEEAIEFIKSIKGFVVYYSYDKKDGKLNEIIDLLKCEEKFEAMWEELGKKYGNYWNVCDDIEAGYLCTIMNNLEQKYFSKGGK